MGKPFDKVIELQALVTEREAMIAANLERQHLGASMAYNDEAFYVLAARMRSLI